MGVGAGLRRARPRHDGLYISFQGRRHHIDLADLTGGKAITVYGQNEVVHDLIEARTAIARPLYFEAEHVSVGDLDSSSPVLRFTHGDTEHEVHCDFIAGCDGFHGICRPSIPNGVLTVYERVYPFGWLGILAEARAVLRRTRLHVPRARVRAVQHALADDHATLFSGASRRADRELVRRCDLAGDADAHDDDATAGRRTVGRIIQKGVTPMRSFVAAPMRYGRLFLAGDAAHIVPPTGAKGLNLAASDVLVLARALKAFYERGRTEWLDEYSDVCLRRVWKAQRFSWWMTSTLHRSPDENAFDHQRQIADLDYLTSSRAAMTSLAEQYVGLPAEVSFESVGLHT